MGTKHTLPALLAAALGLSACGGSEGSPVVAEAAAQLQNGAVVPGGTEQAVYVQTRFADGTLAACTGARIRNGWVLTAAHCFYDHLGSFSASAWVARQPGLGGEPALAIHVHPSYLWDPHPTSTRGFDIALVQLQPSALAEVGTADRALATDPVTSLLGQHVRCYGFGDYGETTLTGGPNDGNLRVGDFVVAGGTTTTLEVQPGTTRSALREGDSGGPCYWDSPYEGTVLVGVNLWSQADLWSGFGLSNVAGNRAWIEGVLEGDRLDARVPEASATTSVDALAVATSGGASAITAVVARDAAGALRFKHQVNGGAWTPTADFATIPLPVAAVKAPAAVWVDSTLYVLAMGADRQLWVAKWLVTGWEVSAVAGTIDAAPTAVSVASGALDAFTSDYATHRLARYRLRSGRWTRAVLSSGPTLRAGSRPALAVWGPSSAALFVVASDGSVRHVDFAPGAYQSCTSGSFGRSLCTPADYSGWTNLGGYVTADPVAAAGAPSWNLSGVGVQPNTVDLVARGSGNLDLFRNRVSYDSARAVSVSGWAALGLSLVGESYALTYDELGHHLYAPRFLGLYACDPGPTLGACAWTRLGHPEVLTVAAAPTVGGHALFGANGAGLVYALRR